MRRLVFILFALGALSAAGIAVAAGAFDGAKPATARFHDLDQAKAAGYTVRVADAAGLTCIAQAGEGAMGIHMLNPALLDGTIDAERHCCRWLQFDLSVTPDGGPTVLTLSGPAGAREFLAALFEL